MISSQSMLRNVLFEINHHYPVLVYSLNPELVVNATSETGDMCEKVPKVCSASRSGTPGYTTKGSYLQHMEGSAYSGVRPALSCLSSNLPCARVWRVCVCVAPFRNGFLEAAQKFGS